MLVGRIFSIHLAFVEAPIFVSISKNHIEKALPKIFTQKPKMNHQIGLLKYKKSHTVNERVTLVKKRW
jgi:hypothetical protein